MEVRLERLVSDSERGATGMIPVDGAWAGFTCDGGGVRGETVKIDIIDRDR